MMSDNSSERIFSVAKASLKTALFGLAMRDDEERN